MRRVFRENGLSIVLASLFLIFWAGQSAVGYREHNNEQREHGQPEVAFGSYLRSAHFWEATAENWESEFLQMFGYVIFTAFLFQKGSSESKDPEKSEPEPVDRDPRASRNKPNAPWPVRKGGWVLKLYENSLSLAFLLFFLTSISLHAVAGSAEYNEEQAGHGEAPVSVLQYAGSSRFWFESLQNWQSEFLAIASMVVLSIFLRQRGSPESKPVDTPHWETGE
jgi:Domain of unknown function (DUF6766)